MSRIAVMGFFVVAFLPLLLASLIADMTWRKTMLLLTVAMLVGGYFMVDNSDAFQRYYWRRTLPALPGDEAAFIAVADDLRVQRAAATSDTLSNSALRQTGSRLCALPVNADRWVGRVEQTYSVSLGGGNSLSIRIWPHLILRTALFPDNTETLIRPGSPLFAPVSGLQAGDVVRFSGRIVGHAGACPDDPLLDPAEKLRDPEFLFRFAEVAGDSVH